jgi:ESCRT-II complex subunit VPS36
VPKTGDETETSDQKAGLIRSSLVKLGLPTPAVTPDMISSDQAYAKELAKELAGLLTRTMAGQSAIMFHGFHDLAVGIRPLDEIWCIWNRARGICKHSVFFPSYEVYTVTEVLFGICFM